MCSSPTVAHEILDEIEKEAACQAETIEEEIGYQKQQLKYTIKEEYLTPYDNGENLHGHIEPFLNMGNKVQTKKYFKDSYKMDDNETEEVYNDQFKEIESLVALLS